MPLLCILIRLSSNLEIAVHSLVLELGRLKAQLKDKKRHKLDYYRLLLYFAPTKIFETKTFNKLVLTYMEFNLSWRLLMVYIRDYSIQKTGLDYEY